MNHRITIELTPAERRQLRMDAALMDISVAKLAKRRVTRRDDTASEHESGQTLTPAEKAVFDR